mmetsp:Transcript_24056/g.44284  ORF Transcript_24056/g.44284 Transcript_24056/m.44284 type:complete len:200 (+) Transcript_24056:396-995(+)
MSRAVRNKRMPPATRKAGMEMPMKPSTASPKRPKTMRMAMPSPQARSAMLRRCFGGTPWVSATKSGARPIGSMTTNMVTKAVMRKAVSIMAVSELFLNGAPCGAFYLFLLMRGAAPQAPRDIFGQKKSGRFGGFELFQVLHPERLGAVERAHHFGIFLLPHLHLAQLGILIERWIGQLLGQLVTHLVQFGHPRFGFADL